jgi:hypothetical protein
MSTDNAKLLYTKRLTEVRATFPESFRQPEEYQCNRGRFHMEQPRLEHALSNSGKSK